MYPFIKLIKTLTSAAFRSKLNLDDPSILNFRVGLNDIDIFMELNNARFFSYLELGRWDFSYRIGLLGLMKEHRWGIAVGGASARFRRRVPYFSKCTLTTQLICHDDRWFYFLQEIHSKNNICFSALIKAGITSKNGLVPATDACKYLSPKDWHPVIPKWISAWIQAEGLRPWPESINSGKTGA